MIVLHGNRSSAPSNRVLYVCAHLALPYRWRERSFTSGELRASAFRRLHPAGKIPVLEEGDFALFESEAICRYLCAKAGGRLLADDPRDQAVVDQWNAFAANHVGLAMGKVVFNHLVAPRRGIDVDRRSLREGRGWLGRYLPILDQRLRHTTFLAGTHLTLADLTLLAILEPAAQVEISFETYPNVGRWQAALQALPFWAATRRGA